MHAPGSGVLIAEEEMNINWRKGLKNLNDEQVKVFV